MPFQPSRYQELRLLDLASIYRQSCGATMQHGPGRFGVYLLYQDIRSLFLELHRLTRKVHGLFFVSTPTGEKRLVRQFHRVMM